MSCGKVFALLYFCRKEYYNSTAVLNLLHYSCKS
ncbi:hypothetical protein NC651_039423 [Populus alba x Populus x berolinensis]|nr:hypothetical protein NC651_039423 [Populus alba x Populus x berolinensis]